MISSKYFNPIQYEREIYQLANKQNWKVTVYGEQSSFTLFFLSRESKISKKNLYISSGIHGDEPAGPLAILELFRESYDFGNLNVFIFPMLSPAGLRANSRTDIHGVDLNRDYKFFKTNEVRVHVDILEKLPCFDGAICLHEDWEANGCYLYELNFDNKVNWGASILKEMSKYISIDLNETIDGRSAKEGVMQVIPNLEERHDWPEAFFLVKRKSKRVYTIETPTTFELKDRVAAQKEAVKTIIKNFK